ncbi:hypothetical protein B0H14DRAFT_2675874 [Mycena olivaceomarginata]|nr:hypothetical protein B0H14DRAFT_2767722 [Mycena olivaceomarginata]KAJ7898016.1 hypothetical protein B0H14DRAFT_2675874 [Mycena olivaceomarginata]
MKHILSAIFVSLVVRSTGALLTPATRSPETCGDPTDARPFYRAYNPTEVDHFYTTNVNLVNAANSGWPLQGVAALVFVTQEEATVPFFRLYSAAATDNFYTISTTERDAALQNGYVTVAGDPFTFIYPTQVCGSVPFYRLYHATKKDNFYTTSESERLDFIANQGYTDIEIAGYVLPVTSTQCD